MKKLDGNSIVSSNFYRTQAPSARLDLFTAERSHGACYTEESGIVRPLTELVAGF